MIKLSQLLGINVIESYEVLAGHNNLDSVVSSVSVLETPEFEKYVIENSLILTTRLLNHIMVGYSIQKRKKE